MAPVRLGIRSVPSANVAMTTIDCTPYSRVLIFGNADRHRRQELKHEALEDHEIRKGDDLNERELDKGLQPSPKHELKVRHDEEWYEKSVRASHTPPSRSCRR